MIKGVAVFKCPRTGEDVRLDRECTNLDGKGNNCPFYKHWSWQGSRPVLTCTYETYEKYGKDVETPQNEEEK